MSSPSPIDVGLIGFGAAGRKFHGPLISATGEMRLRAVSTRRAEEVESRYPGVDVAPNAEAIIENPGIQLVVIATPNATHFDLARQALRAGRHVVVDKPLTVTSEEGRELIAIAAQADRLLSVFQNRRWDGDFLTIRKLIDEGRLGRIVSFESRFDRFRPHPKPGAWREGSEPGSGILFDLGSHLVDQALLLFGQPDRVRGDVRRERDFGEADDAFDLIMRYEKLRVTLGAGMLMRDRTPRFVIRGTEATFVKYGFDPQEKALGSGASPGGEGWGLEPPDAWGSLIDDGGSTRIETLPGNYPAFYENIRDAITTGAPLAVTATEALAAIRVLELARADSRGEPLPALR